MFCSKCGAELADGSAFCSKCGAATGQPSPVNQGRKTVGQKAGSVVGKAADALNEMTGGEGHVELKFRNLFDSVFKKHESSDIDELFACGSPKTTPPISQVSREWPHPWVYSRVFMGLLVTLLGLYGMWYMIMNPLMLPGLFFVGGLLVNASIVVLFFETNAPRNMSIVRVLEAFFVGGVMSLVFTAALSSVFPVGTGKLVPSMLTGLIEELGKVGAAAFFLHRTRSRNYILTGLLIGAAVGAGFAVFETAGYIFFFGLNSTTEGMMNILIMRAALAFGGHVAWCAVEGGALALCDEGDGFKPGHLTDFRFIPYLIGCIVLHGIWDATVPILGDDIISLPIVDSPKCLLLGFAVWVMILVLMHRGFEQINQLQTMPQAVAGGGAAPDDPDVATVEVAAQSQPVVQEPPSDQPQDPPVQ